MTLALIVAAFLQAADIWTTNRALANGAQEANPFVRFLMQRFGGRWWAPKLAVAAAGYGAMAFAALGGWGPAVAFMWLLNAAYAVVVGRNWRLGHSS